MKARTSLFLFNRSQAMRLPRAVAFGEVVREVVIVADGARRIVTPADSSWDDVFAGSEVDLGWRHQPEAGTGDSF